MKNKKSILFVILSFLVFGISGTLAYYKINLPSETTIATSHFDTEIETVYESPSNWQIGSTDNYEYKIENKSDKPFMVRVSFTDSWTDGNGLEYSNIVNGEKIGIINFANSGDWKKIGNYYYYKNSILQNATTSNLITGFTFNSQYDGTKVCTYDANTNLESCVNSPQDYKNLTYKVSIKAEIIQTENYEEVWNVLDSTVKQDSTYTVNFHPNATDAQGTMTSEDFVYGTSKTLNQNLYTRSGYLFKEWNTSYKGVKDSYEDLESVLDIANGDTDILDLYATWKNIYNVSFASGDVTNCPLDSSYTAITNIPFGSLVKDTAIPNPVCTGYTFTGWSMTGDIDTNSARYGSISTPVSIWVDGNKGTYFKDLSTVANGNVLLTANFIPSIYTITLNNQSATTAGTAIIYEKYNTNWYSESSATNVISTITVPSKTAYYFDGYYTEQNGEGTKVIDSTGAILSSNTAFTANTTLYANWVEVWAENLSFNPTVTGFSCSDAQCAIDKLYEFLN